MATGIWVLGDQLNPDQSALAAHRPGEARVLLIESTSVLASRAYHRQKLVLVWSAMRHFAAELQHLGWQVDLIEAPSFTVALERWCREHAIDALHVMEPADRPFRQAIARALAPIAGGSETAPEGSQAHAAPLPKPDGPDSTAARGLDRSKEDPTPPDDSLLPAGLRLVWHPSNAFLWSREEFAAWAGRYRQLRMELFYREGRRRFGVLMDPSGEPLGDQWNFDHDNRKAPPKGLRGPVPLRFEPDSITAAVIAKVESLDAERQAAGLPPLPGSAIPFGWGVSRQQALEVLEHFIATRLDGFGPYQDAMVSGEPTLWHALLSPYLNLGLLHPLEVIRRLEQAGLERAAPLAGLEGVIRQILGWREYTHGLYHWFGDDYAQLNHFKADAPLPGWLESLGESGMQCMDTVLAEIHVSGYAHHIQRLMVLANYGLLAGLDPQALTSWFHRMFIDGFDWVMQTNVLGMGVFADGGRLASKPYAASGNYIRRMSTYCRGCHYDVKARSGERACPFNVLYWDFLARHQEQLVSNPRMGLVMRQLEKLDPTELEAIRATAADLLSPHGF